MTTEPTKSATPRMEAMFIALKNGDGISEGCEDYYSLGCKIETELTAMTANYKSAVKYLTERDQLKQQLAEAVKALKIALDCAYWKGQYPYEHLPEFRTAISAAMNNPTKEP